MGGSEETQLRVLEGRNALLDEQVKRLVRTEQKLYLSQRDLARQLARVDALAHFAVDVAGVESAADIVLRAADVLLALFPLDQYVGFLADGAGLLTPSVVSAAPGREPRVPWRACDREAIRLPVVLPPEAIIDRAGVLRRDRPEAAVLLDRLERIFADPASASSDGADAHVLMIPIASGTRPAAAMVFRRIRGPLSFHEDLPSQKDAAFLALFAQQVGAALTNAHLVERERFAALGELAALVAHEVRNPLGAIFNSLSMLTRLVAGRHEEQQLVAIVREESERLNQIVSELIEFARPHAAVLREEVLHAIAAEALDHVRSRYPRTTFALSVDDPTPTVSIDASMVRQALINLLVNAVQASPDARDVAVRIELAEPGWVRIAVIDHGAGIPEGLAARIFEPFFTRKASGTGLGLAVVKRVAEAHGGKVEATPTAGGGTTFVLSLSTERTAR